METLVCVLFVFSAKFRKVSVCVVTTKRIYDARTYKGFKFDFLVSPDGNTHTTPSIKSEKHLSDALSLYEKENSNDVSKLVSKDIDF